MRDVGGEFATDRRLPATAVFDVPTLGTVSVRSVRQSGSASDGAWHDIVTGDVRIGIAQRRFPLMRVNASSSLDRADGAWRVVGTARFNLVDDAAKQGLVPDEVIGVAIREAENQWMRVGIGTVRIAGPAGYSWARPMTALRIQESPGRVVLEALKAGYRPGFEDLSEVALHLAYSMTQLPSSVFAALRGDELLAHGELDAAGVARLTAEAAKVADALVDLFDVPNTRRCELRNQLHERLTPASSLRRLHDALGDFGRTNDEVPAGRAHDRTDWARDVEAMLLQPDGWDRILAFDPPGFVHLTPLVLSLVDDDWVLEKNLGGAR